MRLQAAMLGFMLLFLAFAGCRGGAVDVRAATGPISTTLELSISLPHRAVVDDVTCVPEGGGDERHTTHSPQRQREHTVVFTGLLASKTYTCTVVAVGDEQRLTVTTEPLPAEIEALEMSLIEGPRPGAQHGYTLFSAFDIVGGDSFADNHVAVVVDAQARVRWYRVFGDLEGEGANAFELDESSGQFVFGGGVYDTFVPHVLDQQGEIVEIWGELDDVHHDVRIVGEHIVALTRDGHGYCLERYDRQNRNLVDRWCSSAVSDRLGDSHLANSFTLVEGDPDQLVVAMPHSATTVRLDMAQGDVPWIYGVDREFDLDFTTDRSHDVHVVPCDDDLCLLYYDNNVLGGQSRVVLVGLDEDTMQARLHRAWSEEGWFEPNWGGIEQLEPSGNWLVGIGHNHLTSHGDGPSAVVEVDPDGEVVWRMELGETFGMDRARRVDPCDLFTNVGFCEERGW